MQTCYNQATTLRSATLQQTLTNAEAAGFDYIELWISSFGEYLASHSFADLKAFFAVNHLKPFALDSFEDVNFRDGRQSRQLLYEFERACNLAAMLDCRRIVAVPTVRPGLARQYDTEDAFRDSVGVLSDLGRVAEPYGVKVAFEPIGFEDCAVRTIGQAWEIVREVGLANVGLTLDVFNLYLGNRLTDLDDLRLVDPGKIFIFHINDAPVLPPGQYSLDHGDRVFPGFGALPYREMIRVMREVGYAGPASVELFNRDVDAMDPAAAVALACQTLRQALAVG